jgi:hypothetical protein
MKSKILILIVFAAVATLSFSFSRTSTTPKKIVSTSVSSNLNAPAGGFISEDKF